jgi:hypothetical protein
MRVVHHALPESVARLFWDVDPATVELERHRDYVMERVMSRGTWEAMRWLQRAYSRSQIADFLGRKGHRLPARDQAYWSLVAKVTITHRPGGGRPSWAG